ncbi:sister chromatid cohesion 1 protein 4 [Senna tora]|uniref:Sister chromatid cohesion 1 protein 4 n=1 Tax=Senna tora TaxID=362788 RepID=A0A834TAZ5_9FABA|nr:sister chromatid cohesion 1 protein 4 [Senna tora]
MFYSQFILAKKGPLGTIWIAAHLERKLRKNQVADTDIGVSVDSILFPEVPIALRLSSHLLLGVVRIYSRKVNYLFDDCSEALLKIKQAFRSTAVDLPPEESTAPYHSITLPETFDLDDFELPDNDIFQGNYVDHHVSTREQITLQDTMDGAVYTTSQFGLDERFGDGDASQIGLDLEEDLLVEKASTLEHDDISYANPQESIQTETALEESEMKEEVSDTLDGMPLKVSGNKIDSRPSDIQVSEYAQGPSTPGLEEPNLFGTQVAQIINEAEYNNSGELVSMKSTPKVSTAREEEAIDCFMQDRVKNGSVVDLHNKETDDNNRGEQHPLECLGVTKGQENLTISASGISEKVEELHDGVVINNDPVVASPDQTVMNFMVTRGVGVNENVTSPSCSHVTYDMEDLCKKLSSHSDFSKEPESDGCREDNQALVNHEILTDNKIANEGDSTPFVEGKVSSAVCLLGSPGRPEVVDVEAKASQELKEADALNHIAHESEQPNELHLRPCTSGMNLPDVLSIGGEQCHMTNVTDPALGGYQTTDRSVCKEIHPDFGKSDGQYGSQIFSDNQVKSDEKSAASDMLAPEKMLSAYQLNVEPNDLLMESTPDDRDTAGGITSVEGEKCISGKKRSFTESTLTLESVDLVESYGGTPSKRSTEVIPDDDDLLSSILVGRRSSFLKVKPTPVVSEVASIKRTRSAPRTSTLKRKVLMDDTMVLHGDTIRQQLTNTEDIRRIRKKAPCTHHEILMIQRQFLEDEVFQESIFTGVSADLLLLQNEKFDLTGIKIYDYDLDSSVLEATHDKESYSRTIVAEVHGVERNVEPVAVHDVEEEHAELPVLSECNQSEFNVGSLDIYIDQNTEVISHVKEHNESQAANMNSGRGNIEVSHSETCSIVPGLESSPLTDFDNNCCMPNDFATPLTAMDKTYGVDGSVHTDILGISTTQSVHTLPVVEDELVEDKSNTSGVGTTEISEDRVEIRTQVEVHGSEAANNLYASLTTGSKRTDEYTNDLATVNRDLCLDESEKSMLGGINEDQILASGSGYDDEDSRFGCSYSENTRVDCLHGVAVVLDAKDASLINEENSVSQEAQLQSTMHPEISAIDSPLVDQNDVSSSLT